MKPLNPTDVIWLSGTGDEINLFLKEPQVRDRGLILGHPEDPKRTLQMHAAPGPLGIELSRLSGQQDLFVVFLLLEGKVVGLIKDTRPKKDEKP